MVQFQFLLLFIFTITYGGDVDCLTANSCNGQTKHCSEVSNGQKCKVTCGGSSGASSACLGATINCENGVPCEVYCNRFQACYGASIYGRNATSLTVITATISGENRLLYDADIYCGDTAFCEITCSDNDLQCYGLFVNAESAGQLVVDCQGDQNDHCQQSHIYCPKEKATCWIKGPSAMSNIHIYSQMGFDGVEICGSANSVSVGTMHCESQYGQPCAIDQANPNQCASSTPCDDTNPSISMDCNPPVPTAPTTSNPTTSSPTTHSPTTLVPTTSIPTTVSPTTSNPSVSPSKNPSSTPTKVPSNYPTSGQPSTTPSQNPTSTPSQNPSISPSKNPTKNPTAAPTTIPSRNPTRLPTSSPTDATIIPTSSPSDTPPTSSPTTPSETPTTLPTETPTTSPSQPPSNASTRVPTANKEEAEAENKQTKDTGNENKDEHENSNKGQIVTIIVATVGILAFICIMIVIVLWYAKMNKKRTSNLESKKDVEMQTKRNIVQCIPPMNNTTVATDIITPTGNVTSGNDDNNNENENEPYENCFVEEGNVIIRHVHVINTRKNTIKETYYL